MTTTTAGALINAVFKLCGITGASETPSASEQQDALATLNAMIDSWGTSRLTMLAMARYLFDLVANQQTYSIGVGGDFAIEPPLLIDHVGLLFPGSDPAIETPVGLLTDDQYAGLQVKELENSLIAVAYYSRPTAAVGTLYLWAKPTEAQTIALYVPVHVAQFSNVVEEVTMAAGYYAALYYNLATRLYPEYQLPMRTDVAVMAREALADIKRANFQMTDLGMLSAFSGMVGPYNIFTDTP